MGYRKQVKIAVTATNGSGESEGEMRRKARILGQQIAKNNGILIAESCQDLSREAVQGANEAGGSVLGNSSAIDAGVHIFSQIGIDELSKMYQANGFKVLGLLVGSDAAAKYLSQQVKQTEKTKIIIEAEPVMLIWRMLRYIEDPERDRKRFFGK